MARSVSKDAILDAAEAIAGESGSVHMTLDAVAARAQISKGGLMYTFPNKEALLQGMIGRLIANFEERREKVRQEMADPSPNELVVELKMMADLDETGSRHSAALLATLANQPELMAPFHEEMRKQFSERILSQEDPDRATVIFLAAMGLHFNALLNIPILDQEQRKKTYENLMRLALGENDI